jgi:hypothetical protein
MVEEPYLAKLQNPLLATLPAIAAALTILTETRSYDAPQHGHVVCKKIDVSKNR